jgi:hypothetical protein
MFPLGALDWSDADDNNAFHAKQIIMDLDGTISTELAMYHDPEKYHDVVTLGLPNDDSGRSIPSPLGVSGAFIPKGAKSVEAAKDFVFRKVAGEYLKAGSVAAGDSRHRKERLLVDRPQGPAPAGLRYPGRAGQHGALSLRL